MKTHPVSVTHLVFGLVFLGIAGAWALDDAGVIHTDGLPWVLPLILVIAGAAGVVASVTRSLRRDPEPDQGYEPSEPYEPSYLYRPEAASGWVGDTGATQGTAAGTAPGTAEQTTVLGSDEQTTVLDADERTTVIGPDGEPPTR